ncbi:MAG: hypothetical protein K8F91_12935 [Candidatus Obscuribacterales bacterium]|nr:hypothetical protein [Candidatus Obscuribacterales bacterium]
MTIRSKASRLTVLYLAIILLAGCSPASNLPDTTSNAETPAPPAQNAEKKKQEPKDHDSSASRDKDLTIKTNTKPVTLTGEVIDVWCYVSGVMGSGRGKEHEKCAKLCVAGGVSAGILTDDGTVYIAAKHQGYKGCAGLLLPYVAQRVEVKGGVAEKGGCRVLKIREVKPVASSKATSTTSK